MHMTGVRNLASLSYPDNKWSLMSISMFLSTIKNDIRQYLQICFNVEDAQSWQ